MSKVEYIRRFLAILKDLNANIAVFCLNRGFYLNYVFSVLQKDNIPHIVPVRKHCKELQKILRGKHSRYAKYTMIRIGEPLDLTLAIDVQYLQGNNKKFGNVNLGYVVYGVDWNPWRVYRDYKNRFAIQSSYRMRNIVRAKTSSRII